MPGAHEKSIREVFISEKGIAFSEPLKERISEEQLKELHIALRTHPEARDEKTGTDPSARPGEANN